MVDPISIRRSWDTITVMIGTVREVRFPAAGLGLRFLPVSKARPTEMLVLVDKPTPAPMDVASKLTFFRRMIR